MGNSNSTSAAKSAATATATNADPFRDAVDADEDGDGEMEPEYAAANQEEEEEEQEDDRLRFRFRPRRHGTAADAAASAIVVAYNNNFASTTATAASVPTTTTATATAPCVPGRRVPYQHHRQQQQYPHPHPPLPPPPSMSQSQLLLRYASDLFGEASYRHLYEVRASRRGGGSSSPPSVPYRESGSMYRVHVRWGRRYFNSCETLVREFLSRLSAEQLNCVDDRTGWTLLHLATKYNRVGQYRETSTATDDSHPYSYYSSTSGYSRYSNNSRNNIERYYYDGADVAMTTTVKREKGGGCSSSTNSSPHPPTPPKSAEEEERLAGADVVDVVEGKERRNDGENVEDDDDDDVMESDDGNDEEEEEKKNDDDDDGNDRGGGFRNDAVARSSNSYRNNANNVVLWLLENPNFQQRHSRTYPEGHTAFHVALAATTDYGCYFLSENYAGHLGSVFVARDALRTLSDHDEYSRNCINVPNRRGLCPLALCLELGFRRSCDTLRRGTFRKPNTRRHLDFVDARDDASIEQYKRDYADAALLLLRNPHLKLRGLFGILEDHPAMRNNNNISNNQRQRPSRGGGQQRKPQQQRNHRIDTQHHHPYHRYSQSNGSRAPMAPAPCRSPLRVDERHPVPPGVVVAAAAVQLSRSRPAAGWSSSSSRRAFGNNNNGGGRGQRHRHHNHRTSFVNACPVGLKVLARYCSNVVPDPPVAAAGGTGMNPAITKPLISHSHVVATLLSNNCGNLSDELKAQAMVTCIVVVPATKEAPPPAAAATTAAAGGRATATATVATGSSAASTVVVDNNNNSNRRAMIAAPEEYNFEVTPSYGDDHSNIGRHYAPPHPWLFNPSQMREKASGAVVRKFFVDHADVCVGALEKFRSDLVAEANELLLKSVYERLVLERKLRIRRQEPIELDSDVTNNNVDVDGKKKKKADDGIPLHVWNLILQFAGWKEFVASDLENLYRIRDVLNGEVTDFFLGGIHSCFKREYDLPDKAWTLALEFAGWKTTLPSVDDILSGEDQQQQRNGTLRASPARKRKRGDNDKDADVPPSLYRRFCYPRI